MPVESRFTTQIVLLDEAAVLACMALCADLNPIRQCDYELEPGLVEGTASLAEELRARGQKLAKMLVSILSG